MSKRPLLVLAFALLAAFAACSNADDSGAASGSAQDCLNRCDTLLSRCGGDPAQCGQLCTQVTEEMLECLEASKCDSKSSTQCLGSTGLNGGNGGAAGSGFGLGGAGGTTTMPSPGGFGDTGLGGAGGAIVTGMCTTDSQCQTPVMCTCPDGSTATTTSGSCTAGTCFHDNDASICADECLTHGGE